MCALCCDSTSFFQYNYRLKLILPFFGKTMRMMPLQIEVMNSVKGIIKQIELWEVVAQGHPSLARRLCNYQSPPSSLQNPGFQTTPFVPVTYIQVSEFPAPHPCQNNSYIDTDPRVITKHYLNILCNLKSPRLSLGHPTIHMQWSVPLSPCLEVLGRMVLAEAIHVVTSCLREEGEAALRMVSTQSPSREACGGHRLTHNQSGIHCADECGSIQTHPRLGGEQGKGFQWGKRFIGCGRHTMQ